ncbi:MULTISPECIES: DUF1657 domain-containing protein [Thermoactinomyces]|jgi:hypothetical protein|uniref:DUF1657 domain-containing protein n=1 Tax=Thermoactinomyces daqus TaxID=1329516 RepID=A0A7W1X8S3_9BACL|nr:MULTISPECIES: DUF1657 domain-containing protein [Thermoactinomyces]MBA4542177.1 DUF1657 domain-containing protein [Thermoactinomyces daqus]MBH8598370.1 DUF1657 domain-containing protein [Thermoactinomyces sp. CICC 10523]MBH8604495.1 DUF1657 domain-containing protein [Thermoactinomyces sp. CICC 10522]MBH8607504.1 DUF1657 domain-containing protein [Thermoactinomyces sp. CICC 10521]
MTVAAKVKTCLASLRSAQAGLEQFSVESQTQDAKKVFSEAAQTVLEIIEQVERRVGELEREEPEYKGF